MIDDDNVQDESPAADAPLLPEETQAADSSTAKDANETASSDDAGSKSTDEVKPVSENAQKRIDRLTWEKREKEREAEYWRQRALEVAKPAEPPKPPEPAPTMPTLEAFGYDEAKYQAALVDFARAEARRETEAILSRKEQEAQQRAREQTFREREAAAKKKYDDYESVAYYAPINDTVVELVKESEDGPEIAYYLGKNPEIARTLSQLPERAVAREIGRIEARLAAQRETPPAAAPAVSKAPPPPPKVEATEPAIEKDPDSMDDAQWYRHVRRLDNLKQFKRKS